MWSKAKGYGVGLADYARQLVVNADREPAHLLRLVRKYVQADSRILDVGSGYGRNLVLLKNAGYRSVLGVEINAEIVASNRTRGLNCVTVDDFHQSKQDFDMILMSHVIEHFAPAELKEFIDGYLDRLAPGGYLVIVTPLMSDYFYDDFDHVKPYQPIGIQLVFGGNGAQVQYYSRNRLALRDLWFRKGYYHLSFFRSKYIESPISGFLRLATAMSALLFVASKRLIGKKDGWIGVYQKLQPAFERLEVPGKSPNV